MDDRYHIQNTTPIPEGGHLEGTYGEPIVVGYDDVIAHIDNTNNPHEVTKAQVGLGNANDTSDIDKPISAATQAALDLKQNITGGNFTFGEAIDTTDPGIYFATSTNSLATPTALWGSLTGPYPTNVWWQNLALGTASNPVNTHPYKVAALTTGLRVTYPKVAYSTMTVNANGQFITTASHNNLSFFFSESLTARNIIAYDDLTVTNRFTVSAGTTYMDAYLAKGSPYVTVKYTGLTPKITTQHAITNVNGTTSFPANITSDRFEVVLNNGQTWIVYFDASVTLAVSNTGGWQMLASTTFTGVARMAIRESADDETLLDTYKGAYATGGSVDASVDGGVASTTFSWTRAGSGPLLMLALPHHQDTLVSTTLIDTDLVSLKGALKGVVGDTWTLQDSLSTITFNAPREIQSDKLATIQAAFDTDKTYVPAGSASPYTGGKEMSKAARLAMVGDALGDTTGVNTLLTNLQAESEDWLNGLNSNPIKYDTTWGGLVSTNGLVSSSNDFGNGIYNDHHFHRGYHIYAAAIVAHLDDSWAAGFTDQVNLMVRDIMNPSASDTYFPRFRMTDWYDGHSWAHGLGEIADAKDQESFSEAINAWYGAALWGLAIGDYNIYNHARILLAMEIRAMQRYMQIKTGNDIYPSPFSNNKMVGIMFANKVDNTTFFGNNLEYINEINTIPVTPITEEYIDYSYAQDVDTLSQQMLDRNVTMTVTRVANAVTAINITSASANNKGFGVRPPTVSFSGGGGTGAAATAVLTSGELTSFTITNGGSGYTSDPTVTLSADLITDPWRGFIIAKRAQYDKEQAWTDAAALATFDEGQSKSNLLYWIATRDNDQAASLDASDVTYDDAGNSYVNGATVEDALGSAEASFASLAAIAGDAVLNTDTSTADMDFVIDEDNMASNSNTKVPTQQSVKAYTDLAVAAIVNSAPSVLDTLDELAAALGDDANFSTTVTTALADKASISSANTYTSGAKQTLSQSATTAGFSLGNVAGNPSSPAEGDLWYNSSGDDLIYRAGASNRTVVNTAASQTLTNKTLTAPVISTISNTGTVTLPTATDTLVGRATTDTLTNKTIDANGTGNSISNLEVADFAGTAIVTESEGLGSSDNDTSVPTTAAVKDYVDNAGGGGVETIGILDAGSDQLLGTGQTPHYTAYFHAGPSTTVNRMTAQCGTFAGSGTVELGIYSAARAKLSSGTATLSASGIFSVTLGGNVTLSPGTLYYFAMLNANANNNGFMAELTDIQTGTLVTFQGATAASVLPANEATTNSSNRGIWVAAWKA